MMQFFISKDSAIATEFKQRFIDSYLNRNSWIQSDKLYEWYITIKPNYEYNDFLKKLRVLVDDCDLKEFRDDASRKVTGRPKKIYLVSY